MTFRDAVLAELGGLNGDAYFLDPEFSFARGFTRPLRDRRVTLLTRFAAALSTLSCDSDSFSAVGCYLRRGGCLPRYD